ncbi:MAG: alpha/beta-hydrolase family protein, partial [Candidatus Nanopelagicales bacterium]
SFTPSLLPRSAVLQGLVAGVAGAFGYGIGETLAWAFRRVFRWRPAPTTQRLARRILGIVGAILVVLALVLGRRWQSQLHELMGMPTPPGYDSLLILVIALVVCVGLVALGRVLRRLTRWVLRHTTGRLPLWLARTVAVTAVTLLVVGLLSGVVFRAFIAVSNEAFSVRDTTTDAGAIRPSTPERSGSPESLIPWDTLGRQGRNFVGLGPTQEQIASFSGTQAMAPVRVYAGLESAPTVNERVDLIVQDLRRAGAFDRSALIVATTTGTGWVDPKAVDAVEYMLGGDTAIAALQYSYLPSWMSFLVDKSKAQDAGVTLFDGVYDAWSQLPDDQRPRLYIFGESLGAFGVQEAFPTLDDMAARTDGAVLAGTPNFTELWSTLVSERDPGSPERLPVYEQGVTARWAATPLDLGQPPTTWTTPRMAYLQHASDPIVWWSPNLLLHEPDWLHEPPGTDVLPAMHWMPWVTFWQVSADMVFSTGVPDGHGHVYQKEYVDAWAAVTQPTGWTAADTERLRALIE